MPTLNPASPHNGDIWATHPTPKVICKGRLTCIGPSGLGGGRSKIILDTLPQAVTVADIKWRNDMNQRWQTAPSPEGIVLDTKIDDENGVRNEQKLVRDGGLWWYPDRSMYVYYRPTHWRYPA